MADLFEGHPVTHQDMLGTARRELALRRRVYPRLVAGGKMFESEAKREIQVMEAIIEHFAKLVADGPR